MNPRIKANSLNYSTHPPVDIYKTCKELNITIQESSEYLLTGNIITINSTASIELKRFNIAFCLGLYFNYDDKNSYIFAAELLAPFRYLEPLCKAGYSSAELAKCHIVPVSLITYQLKSLLGHG